MKKLPLILSIVALLGVVALFVLHFVATCNIKNGSGSTNGSSSNGDLKIAYILSDSVLVNYQLALDLNAGFVEQQKQFNAEFTKKRSDLEKEAVAFQEKLQRGGFLTEDRAVKERDRILAQEQDMQRMDYELSARLQEMEQKINIQLVDSIVSYVKEYNKKHNYSYIFSNNGNIIVGDPEHNLSKEIIEGLNARYAKSKK